jgi:hypothetical protein
MNKYKIVKQLGDGSFGSVLQAQNIENGETVCAFFYPFPLYALLGLGKALG